MDRGKSFVQNTLEVSTHEQRLRYQAEMSVEERVEFATLLREQYEEAGIPQEIPDWL